MEDNECLVRVALPMLAGEVCFSWISLAPNLNRSTVAYLLTKKPGSHVVLPRTRPRHENTQPIVEHLIRLSGSVKRCDLDLSLEMDARALGQGPRVFGTIGR